MNLLDNLGISYKANYLIQGNQIERCNTSKKLNILNTELMLRTDGKDSNIDNILKNYDGNIVFHLPAINPNLSNLDVVNDVVKNLKNHGIKLVTIDASNLSFDLFEWSTPEEQKNYFLNVITSIATLASNKIEVAVQNLKPNDETVKFGSTMGQITDIIVYTKRLLMKDFGFKEEEAEKYVGISLNVDNINILDEKESILNYLEVFDKYIKCIKIHDYKYLDEVLQYLENKNIPLFLQTKADLSEIQDEYTAFENRVVEYLENKGINYENKKIIKKNNNGFSNIIIYTMIVLTIIIVALMFIIKLH